VPSTCTLAECAPRRLAATSADLRVVTGRLRRRQLAIGQPAQSLLMTADLGQQLPEQRQLDCSGLLQQPPHDAH
jgi:hypothetical protein